MKRFQHKKNIGKTYSAGGSGCGRMLRRNRQGRSICNQCKEIIGFSCVKTNLNHDLCFTHMPEIRNMLVPCLLPAAVQNIKRITSS